jgi:hypothetical protein
LGASPFSFSDMSGEQFEQFCWWLLRKDHDLVGCQVLGKQGAKPQGGMYASGQVIYPAPQSQDMVCT